MERLHAVRRLQILKMKQELPHARLEDIVPIACSLRNKLRTIHGSSPSQMVFGVNHHEGGLMDEPAMTNAADPSKQHQELQQMRLIAAKAFREANSSQTLRKH